MLSGDLHTIPVIRPGTFDMGELGRDKPDLSVFVPAFGKFLHPFQGSFFGPKIGPQDRIAFCHIVGTGFPVLIFRIGMFPVVEVDRITFRYFLLFGNTKLFLFCFLSKVALKIFSRADQHGIGQFVCDHGIVLSLFRCPVMDSASPALYLF